MASRVGASNLTEKTEAPAENTRYLNFPFEKRRVFDENYLQQVIIELRFPTLLKLKEEEPSEIQQQIRNRFPLYSPGQRMQVTPLGSTQPEPVYEFANRAGDPRVQLSASNLVLTSTRYESFDKFITEIEFLIQKCLPYMQTDFFTRIGLRYINSIGGIPNTATGYSQWINTALLSALNDGAIGTVNNMKSEIAGPLKDGGNYNFKYGLSPAEPNRTFVLDYDYGRENVEAEETVEILRSFHKVHFEFFR